MTPFAQLGQIELEKAAVGKAIGRGLGWLGRGVWGNTRRAAQKRLAKNPGSKGWKALDRTAAVLGSRPVRYAGYYGIGDMGYNAFTGKHLPGGQLGQAAMTASMPGWAMMDMPANAITAYRMSNPENQAKLKNTAATGAMSAGGDFLTMLQAYPELVTQSPDAYKKWLQDSGAWGDNTSGFLDGKAPGNPVSTLEGVRSMFSPGGTQGVIDKTVSNEIKGHMNRFRRGVYDPNVNASNFQLSPDSDGMTTRLLNKSGSFQPLLCKEAFGKTGVKWLGKLFGGGKKRPPGEPGLLGKTLAGLGAGGVGLSSYRAATADKPYDEVSAHNQGYDAAQAAIQHSLSNMNDFERLAARFDPTLVARRMEQAAPGTIKHWENTTGYQYRPGFLSRQADAWEQAGRPSYYTYDVHGRRHYLR